MPKLTNNTEKYTLDEAKQFFALTAKDNPKDLVQVEIGDSKDATKFFPQVKHQRWDNECNVSIRLKDFDGFSVATETDKVKLITPKKEVHFYETGITEENPENAYEFEVILKEKPKTNVLEFTLQDKDVEYFYQPELTEKEIEDGASRPENVVGSYAVYAKEQKTNYVGGKEYKCGKVGHIFRPRIEDANGDWTWGELHIENGILSVTIPQEFLDKAVYPVRHAAGLTFGFTANGGSEVAFFNPGQAWANRTTTPSDIGTISKVTVWCKNGSGASNGWFKGGFWNLDYSTVTNGYGVTSSEISASSDTEYDSTYSTSPTLSASTDYWLGLIDNAGGGSGSDVFSYDTGGTTNYGIQNYVNSFTTPVALNNVAFGLNSNKYSIYATYTEGGGTPANDTRSSKISGKDTGNSARNSKITGKDTANSFRSSKITGKSTANDYRSAKITGKDTGYSFRTSKITGKSTVNDFRAGHITGKDSANSARGAKLSGVAVGTDNRGARVKGQDTASDSRGAKIEGATGGVFDSRGAKIWGVDSIVDGRNAKIIGQDSANSSRPAKIVGKDTALSQRSAKTKGMDSASSSRSAKVTGKNQIVDLRGARIHGKSTAGDLRGAKITGSETAQDYRGASIEGVRIYPYTKKPTSPYSKKESPYHRI